MKSLFFGLTLFLMACDVCGQSLIQQRVDDYLEKHGAFRFTYKDSASACAAHKARSAYFYTNKYGQTTLTVPRGAISFEVPKGDSVVYAKVVSPKFAGETMGVLAFTHFREGKKADERVIGMGRINGKTGVRVDIAVDNKDCPMAYCYFLSGMIQEVRLQKSPDTLIQAFDLGGSQKEIVYGSDIWAYLFYEDTKAGKVGKQIRQWFSSLNRKEFVERIGRHLKNYSIVSYKLKKP